LDAKKAIATGRDPETLGLLCVEGLWAPRTQGGSRGPLFCKVWPPLRALLRGGAATLVFYKLPVEPFLDA
jgi:hypothetical protein